MATSWQPKALKKRGAEFVVDTPSDPTALSGAASASASAPPSSQAAGSAGGSSFGGEKDLDDLEGDEGAAPSAKKAKPTDALTDAPPRDEIVDAAPRLAQHITSAAKFNKVAAMAYALLSSGRVTADNAGAFFTVLEAAMLAPRRLREPAYKVGYRKLFAAAVERTALFPTAAQAKLRQWELQVVAQVDLCTDDSFQFNRIAKQLRERLTALPCIYPALEPTGAVHAAEAERAGLADTLFECVDAAMAHHKYPWAKTTCDMLVKEVVDRRQNFSDEQAEQIRAWHAKCKGQKVVRQQQYASSQRDQTAYERKEAEWRSADIAKGSGGGEQGGGLDNWMAKQE